MKDDDIFKPLLSAESGEFRDSTTELFRSCLAFLDRLAANPGTPFRPGFELPRHVTGMGAAKEVSPGEYIAGDVEDMNVLRLNYRMFLKILADVERNEGRTEK